MAVLDTRHDVLATLGSWSDLVVQELSVTAPRRDVSQLSQFLLHHLNWLAEQFPAADFADEVEELIAQLRSTIDPDIRNTGSYGRPCVVPDCDGSINPEQTRHGAGRAASIDCSAGHSWEIHELLNIRQLMEQQREDVTA
ncbi:hypothetical protein [Streptomyces sp. YIM 130001]|uniref:hypothetical protein n=1 Tax=Streptomyces sp. YIM 130001 TaxID=2259644 RepID=UPI001F08D9F1|nr:hypothetical protein [Streptomyces sp. YIM 130001]